MKLYTIYSDNYKSYYDNLKLTCDTNNISIIPIYITNPGSNFRNSSFRIVKIIELIEQNINQNLCLIDTTSLLFNSNFINFDLVDNDIYIAREYSNPNSTKSCTTRINLGMMIFKCNSNTLSFFKLVLQTINHNKDWEQRVIDQLLDDNISWDYIPNEYVTIISNRDDIFTSCESSVLKFIRRDNDHLYIKYFKHFKE